uniref:Uncharacterized protein n=1 Tax=Leersia perrieri TaxID=77586 RepID=A0A0D9VXW2_9ORYZ
MGALCLLPSAPPSCSCGGAGSPSRTPRLARAAPLASSSSGAASDGRSQLACRRRRRAGVARAGGSGGKGEGSVGGGAEFFGEDGVVEDMDGYLNYLSLEYDSVWDTKPSWYSFLIHAYTEMIAERRRKVASGAEDTYGMEKIQ